MSHTAVSQRTTPESPAFCRLLIYSVTTLQNGWPTFRSSILRSSVFGDAVYVFLSRALVALRKKKRKTLRGTERNGKIKGNERHYFFIVSRECHFWSECHNTHHWAFGCDIKECWIDDLRCEIESSFVWQIRMVFSDKLPSRATASLVEFPYSSKALFSLILRWSHERWGKQRAQQ